MPEEADKKPSPAKKSPNYILIIAIFFGAIFVAGILWGIAKPAYDKYTEKAAAIDEIQNNQPVQ